MEEIVNMRDTKLDAFTAHSVRSGKSGAGKTTALEFELENEFLFNKKKCIDFDSSGRFENCSYSLPETDSLMINKMNNFPDLVKNWQLSPMGFNSEVLMFCGRNLYSYPKLPKNFKIVSFKLQDLTLDLVKLLLGDTPALLPTLNMMQAKFGLDLNVQDIWDVLFKKEFRGKHATISIDNKQKNMIKVRIRAWMQTGMFSDAVDKINFEEMLNENETITCFNSILQYTEDEEQIAYAITLRNMLDCMIRRKVDYRIYLGIREINDFMSWILCKRYLDQYLRKGRTLGKHGVDVSCDTQRPTDIKPHIRRQFSYYHQMKGDMKDAEKMGEVQYITKSDMARVTRFFVGQGMVLIGSRYDVPIEYPPTRHLHVSPKFDILKRLGKEHGWKSYNVEKILKFEDVEVEDATEVTLEESKYY